MLTSSTAIFKDRHRLPFSWIIQLLYEGVAQFATKTPAALSKGVPMFQEESTFTLRFNLEASFPEEYEGDDDHHAWVREWEAQVKPEVVKAVFDTLRRFPTWSSHVRNRGRSPRDEIEVVLHKDFTKLMSL